MSEQLPFCKLCRRAIHPHDVQFKTCRAAVDGVHIPVEKPDLTKRFEVVVVDQFVGVSPYELQNLENMGTPMQFEELKSFYRDGVGSTAGWQKPQFLTVDETYNPPFATTTYRAKADGTVEVWKMRWDSSG